MAENRHDGPLGAVYDATSPEELAALYDGWAARYEADMARAGYRHPAIALALCARHLSRGAGPLLDAGAGTGLAGEWLSLLGYPHVEALDLSERMLSVARSKNVYRALFRCSLGDRLPFPDGYYAGILSTGVFTTGHVGAEALPELFRICGAGGKLVLTVKASLWEAGFHAAIAAMDDQVAIVEQTAPYLSMPGDAATTPSLAVVLSRLPGPGVG